ncbi:MAG TPA: DUF1508 domain-containing protein [Allosphingosinicella sp.]|nr:DUF1508 domain-containing protein [Allosphingosinicella sp.]
MHYEIYRTRFRREWRWRLRAANGRILCASGEGFRNRGDCLANIDLVKRSAPAPVREA